MGKFEPGQYSKRAWGFWISFTNMDTISNASSPYSCLAICLEFSEWIKPGAFNGSMTPRMTTSLNLRHEKEVVGSGLSQGGIWKIRIYQVELTVNKESGFS